MKAKQIALVSALALALGGVASAQTVPAELWVGPPIATTGSELSRGEVVADMQRAMSQPQAAQEAWSGSVVAANITAGALKRSEVMADFNLFARAGLANYTTRSYFEPASAEELRRVAMYLRLRAGPEYSQEVARLEGARLPKVANAIGSDASAD